MQATKTQPRVWIGCLAAYNQGHLHGEWVDASEGLEGLEQARERVLRTSPGDFAEETFLADREGFGSLIGEYEQLDRVARLGELIEEHGEAFIGYAEHVDPNGSPDELAEGFEDAYRGTFDTFEEHAEELISEVGFAGVEQIPDALMPYLDMEMIARDLEQDFFEVRVPEGVAIFWRH